MTGKWVYQGDVNLEHGGTFFKVDDSDQRYGYMDAVRVIDLIGLDGADGLTMIERVTIYGFDNPAMIRDGMRVCGWDRDRWYRGKGKETVILAVADGLLNYGCYDPVSDYGGPHSWIVVNDNYYGNKRSWDGWKPDREETVRLHHEYNGDLRAYVETLLY